MYKYKIFNFFINVSTLTLLLCVWLASCNTETTRQQMLKDTPGTYCLSANTNKQILDFLQCDSLKLILNSDLTYEFYPKLEKLNGFEGTWSLSKDAEISYWVFKTKNGRQQYNRFLGINLGSRDHVLDSLIRFTWDCKQNAQSIKQ
jgi:hypothetical protein